MGRCTLEQPKRAPSARACRVMLLSIHPLTVARLSWCDTMEALMELNSRSRCRQMSCGDQTQTQFVRLARDANTHSRSRWRQMSCGDRLFTD